ncbi:MAG: methyltransferase [Proteobacteria bacterium]|nr:methyltransferase [Pseudomonadota bacterium]
MKEIKPGRQWLKVTVACPAEIVEPVSDLIGVLSGVGVDIKPVSATKTREISGFFAIDTDGPGEPAAAVPDRLADELEKLFTLYTLVPPRPTTEIIDDQDWSTSWQQFFTPFEIVPGLVIKPSWENYTPGRGQRVLEMDPGRAFGTGQHASTKLALSLIASCFQESDRDRPETVLDVGTGTAILAMSAAVFGADRIMAIDNDPEAVAAARHNVTANRLDWNIGVAATALADVPGRYDLVCANIVHDVLVGMAPELKCLLAPAGRVVLAGILRGPQEKNIGLVYGEQGLYLVRSEHEDEWAALLFEGGS